MKLHNSRIKMLLLFILTGILITITITQKIYAFTWTQLPVIGNKPTPTATQTDTQNTQTKSSSHEPAIQNNPKNPVMPDSAITQVAAVTSMRQSECNNKTPKHYSLKDSSSAQLRALEKYESVCNSGIITTVSFFAPTPTTTTQAISYAADTATQLNEFASYNIKPVIFLEPTSNGQILDVNEYKNGAFDAALHTYFNALKKNGITDSMMGLWVSFPEGNIPVWNNIDPKTYSFNVTKTMQIMKQYFPNAKAGLLLDSASYPAGNSWSGSKYTSLLPYINTIPKGLIDSIGLQGFPWTPPKTDTSGSSFNPYAYLQINELAEAARALAVNDIWFNTGTFSRAYANNPTQTVTVSAMQRQNMLDAVIKQAQTLKNMGFTMAIHMFNENKAATQEGIDWSYWQDDQSTKVFKNFTHDATASGIPLWLFDVKE